MARSGESHAEFVRTWLEERLPDAPPVETVGELVLAALRAIWSRSRTSLGEVTLGAIYQRVFATSQTHSALLQRLDLHSEKNGTFVMNAQAVQHATPDELLEASSFLLSELIRVLGRLTGETLVPSIYEALSSVSVDVVKSPRDRSGP